MHNLRGTEKQGVIKYLMGNPDNSEDIENDFTVDEVYLQYVKQPFIQALHQLELRSDNSTDNQLQKELKNIADLLQ